MNIIYSPKFPRICRKPRVKFSFLLNLFINAEVNVQFLRCNRVFCG